jgi:hypothetical protein
MTLLFKLFVQVCILPCGVTFDKVVYDDGEPPK